MSSPAEDTAPSPPAAGEQELLTVFSRSAPSDFGDRLSKARARSPSSVTPPPQRVSSDGAVALSVSSFAPLPAPGSKSNIYTPPHSREPSGSKPKSYTPNHSPGSMASSRPHVHIPSTVSTSALSRVSVPDSNGTKDNAASIGAIGAERAAGAALPRHPALRRKILAAPLKIMRSIAASADERAVFKIFLDRVCPVNKQAGTQYDRLLPNIEVAYIYIMTDDDYVVFKHMLNYFPLVQRMQKLLEGGDTEFDQVNDQLPAINILLGGQTLEELSQELIKQYGLQVQDDYARPTAYGTWPNFD